MEEDQFRKLIQRMELNEPEPSFTDDVMKMVEAKKEDLALQPALLAIMKHEMLPEPSIDFPDGLMKQIRRTPVSRFEPIITRKMILLFSGILVSIISLYLALTRSGLNHANALSSRINIDLSRVIRPWINIASTILPYLISISMLLCIDYLIRSNTGSLNTRQSG